MGRHGRRSQSLDGPGLEPTAEREALERRWFRQLQPAPELAALVTGQSLADEPFHRWLPYAQAFSPEFVRRFLRATRERPADEPILDPFAGVGTTIVECSRQDVAAIGVEALESLCCVAEAKGARGFPAMPPLPAVETWEDVAARLHEPVHRAALICAVARRHTADGGVNRGAPPLSATFRDVLHMVRDDLATPLPREVDVRVGDARTLEGIADASVAGVLTSPPYLSRHDYARQARAHEAVYRTWYPAAAPPGEQRETQLRAHGRAHAREWGHALPPAVAEAMAALRAGGEAKLAGVVRSYFEDLAAALEAMRRVMRPGAPAWIAIGGARLKGVYVPADLIVAELARSAGFRLGAVRVARRVIAAGRKLGTLTDVAPREVVLVLECA